MLITRRQLLAAAGSMALVPRLAELRGTEIEGADLGLATFSFDVSPPKGHSLCGGWIKPVEDYDDSLQALGLVIVGAAEPIVICAVDWTGLSNDAHIAWRNALAEAAGTASDRVAVQCVHQHNAPFACLNAQEIVGQYAELPHIVDVDFFKTCLERARVAVAAALRHVRPLTHIAAGTSTVEQVASNRRILGPDGKLQSWRGSSCRDAALRALPEGLIDSTLRTVAFFDGPHKIAACHYYATHPMSYYGDGRVSSDFVGLARKRRQSEDPNCLQIYFTGCAGNIAPGKYNDGSPEARRQLTDRVYAAIAQADSQLAPSAVKTVRWSTVGIHPPPRSELSIEELQKQIADPARSVVDRNRPAYTLAWLQRCQRQVPILLSSLNLGEVTLLHLPAESFLEYQLFAQQQAPNRFVATAAYGDGGPWYIPTEDAYPQGGYEVSVAFCDPQVDHVLRDGIKKIMRIGE